MIVFVLTAATLLTILSADAWWQQNRQQQQLLQRTDLLPTSGGEAHIQIAPLRFDAAALRRDADTAAAVADPLAVSRAAAAAAAQRAPDDSQPNLGDGVGVPPPRPQQQQLAADRSRLLPRVEGNRMDQRPAAAMPKLAESGAAVAGGEQLLEGGPKDFKGPANERQRAVVAAFRHAWTGYKEFAWGHDNLKPISMMSHDWFGLGLTIVDSLDTMYIMDLQDGEWLYGVRVCACLMVVGVMTRLCQVPTHYISPNSLHIYFLFLLQGFF